MPDQTSTIISKVWGMCNPSGTTASPAAIMQRSLLLVVDLEFGNSYQRHYVRLANGR